MLKSEDAMKLLALLSRVDIKGSEAPEFMRLAGIVQEIANTKKDEGEGVPQSAPSPPPTAQPGTA